MLTGIETVHSKKQSNSRYKHKINSIRHRVYDKEAKATREVLEETYDREYGKWKNKSMHYIQSKAIDSPVVNKYFGAAGYNLKFPKV